MQIYYLKIMSKHLRNSFYRPSLSRRQDLVFQVKDRFQGGELDEQV